MANKQIDVTADTVKQWAEEVLEEWLIGYTSYDPDAKLQYQVQLLGSQSGDAVAYRVELAKGYGDLLPRRFRVTVMVKEIE